MIKRVLSWCPVLLAFALTIVSGVVQGRISNRWGPPRSMLAAAQQLDKLPEQIGSWQMEQSFPPQKVVVEMLQAQGYVHRSYVNRQTGQAVSLAIVLGPPGPTAVHIPEICYSGSGYTARERRVPATVSASGLKHQFWLIDLESPRGERPSQRVYYAWSTGSGWSATQNPRWTFRAEPYLYKIQLAAFIARSDATNDATNIPDDPVRQFLQEFLNVTQPYFIPTDDLS